MYERYVAIGDSSTEGLYDPDGRGGFRGWANRLAERIAATQGGLLYANLAVRGRSTHQIRNEQLEPALAMRPDLVTLFSGTNDVLGRRFDAAGVGADLAAMHRALIGQGATLLTFTLPDLSSVIPMAGWLAPRVELLNTTLREICLATGGILVDVARHPVACDSRLWSEDRLHGNAEGHARIAAALAEALGIPNSDSAWTEPLPERAPLSLAERVGSGLVWGRRYLLPWLWRNARGQSAGAGLPPKRPTLLPVASRPAA